MNKLGYTEKQVGRMTFGKWSRLYQAYKDFYDMEMSMKNQGVRYCDIDKEEDLDDAIPF
jgi:hypothetical protein